MEQKKKCQKCGNEFLSTNETDSACPKCLAQFVMEKTERSNQEQSPINNEPILSEGTKLGQYEIKEMLGRGGMGTVYKAYQSLLDRFVAIKLLPAKLFTDPEFVTRFNREAKALAGLSHSNIVAIYDIGQEGNCFYFVMEFVEGVTVRQLIEERKLPPEEALKIVPQLCDALEHAHSEGVVHRDIKPENILIDKKGRVKIADFGLARIVRGDIKIDPITKTREVMGTVDYIAPEQRMKSKDVDRRVDIYSLGVVFYEMLTGELPIGKFELPSRKVQIDVRVDDIVLKALEREPSKRYQRASEVGQAVTEILSGTPTAKESRYPIGTKEPVIPMSFNLRSTLSGVASVILGFAPSGISNIIAIILGFFTRAEVKKGRGNKKLLIVSMVGILAGIGSLILQIIDLWNTDPDNFTGKLLFWGSGYILIALIVIYFLRLLFIGNKVTTYDLSKQNIQSHPTYSTLSILSFIFAFIPACITQILAIIFGIIAIRKINRSAGQLKGAGLAIAGIVISSAMIVIIPFLTLPIIIPLVLTARGYQIETEPRIVSTVITTPFLGVIASSINESLARQHECDSLDELLKQLKISKPEGVFILTVNPQSPAAEAKLQEGNIVLEYNNQKVNSPEELIDLLRKSKVGENVKLKILRDGERGIVAVTIGKKEVVVTEPIKNEDIQIKIKTEPEEMEKLMRKKLILLKKEKEEEQLMKEAKIKELSQALKVAKTIKDEQAKDRTIYEISIGYARIGEYAEAIEITKPITEQWKSHALVEITRRYVQSGQKSPEILTQALEVAKTIKDKQTKGRTIYEISIRYAGIGEYDTAIETTKLIESDQWKGQALQEIIRIKTKK